MLYEKVMQGIDTSYVLVFIQDIVNVIVETGGPLFKAARKSVLAKVCHAMMVVESSSLRECWHNNRAGESITWGQLELTVAAARGDLPTLRAGVTRLDHMLSSPYSFVPSPLDAATINGQTCVL